MFVPASRDPSSEMQLEPSTARAIPHQRYAEASGDIDRMLGSLERATEETVQTGELLVEPLAALDEERDADKTPTTARSPWMRSVPPPLPRDD